MFPAAAIHLDLAESEIVSVPLLHLDVASTPVATIDCVDWACGANNAASVTVDKNLEVVQPVGTAVTSIVHHHPLDRVGAAKVDLPPGMPKPVSVCARS